MPIDILNIQTIQKKEGKRIRGIKFRRQTKVKHITLNVKALNCPPKNAKMIRSDFLNGRSYNIQTLKTYFKM